jgi:hypothetical protein
MAAKKSPPQEAEADVRTPVDESSALAVVHVEPIAVEEPPPVVQSSEEPEAAPAPKTVMDFAREKGHVPPKGPYQFRTDPHRGKPHFAVVLAHTGWPPNFACSEEAYDQAVRDAYSISVGENLSDGEKSS